MPSYLVDEGGERTHAVVPVEEYERLKRAAERLESVRGYAMEIISMVGKEDFMDKPAEGQEESPEQHAAGESEETSREQRGYGWQR